MAQRRRPKSLILILAREFASTLATPIYIADSEETLVYFNEPAEKIAGRSFAEIGEIPVRDWVQNLSAETLEGESLAREEMPGGIAFAERRPAHRMMRITGLDGRQRELASTAIPLFGPEGEFHGIMVIFWEQE